MKNTDEHNDQQGELVIYQNDDAFSVVGGGQFVDGHGEIARRGILRIEHPPCLGNPLFYFKQE